MFVAGPQVPYSCHLRSARRPAVRPFCMWGIAMAERAGSVRKAPKSAIPAQSATKTEKTGSTSDRHRETGRCSDQGSPSRRRPLPRRRRWRRRPPPAPTVARPPRPRRTPADKARREAAPGDPIRPGRPAAPPRRPPRPAQATPASRANGSSAKTKTTTKAASRPRPVSRPRRRDQGRRPRSRRPRRRSPPRPRPAAGGPSTVAKAARSAPAAHRARQHRAAGHGGPVDQGHARPTGDEPAAVVDDAAPTGAARRPAAARGDPVEVRSRHAACPQSDTAASPAVRQGDAGPEATPWRSQRRPASEGDGRSRPRRRRPPGQAAPPRPTRAAAETEKIRAALSERRDELRPSTTRRCRRSPRHSATG